MTIRVNAGLFRLASDALPKEEETRYFLHGCYVEPHHERGAMMVSTDGHRMVAIHDPDATCDESAIVKLPRFALDMCKRPKGLPMMRRLLTVDTAAKSATVADQSFKNDQPDGDPQFLATGYRVLVDGTFPDWQRVIPNITEEGRHGSFNPEFLMAFGAFGRALKAELGVADACAMRMWQNDEGSPAVIRWSGVPNVLGVLMPMRADTEAVPHPSFLKPRVVETAEAA